jgi:hypothetical protein
MQETHSLNVPTSDLSRDSDESRSVKQYASARHRATWTVAGLTAVALSLLFVIIANIVQVVQLNQAIAGNPPTRAELERSDRFLQYGGIGYALAFLISAVSYSMWFHRAYRNLPALGAKNLLTKPGWAVGCWFIPILNLFRPFQAAREIVVYSNPGYAGDKLASDVGAPDLLKLWWATWIIGNVLARVAMKVTESAEDASALVAARSIHALDDIILLSAAILAIFIVRRATRDQEERALRLNNPNAVLPSLDEGRA